MPAHNASPRHVEYNGAFTCRIISYFSTIGAGEGLTTQCFNTGWSSTLFSAWSSTLTSALRARHHHHRHPTKVADSGRALLRPSGPGVSAPDLAKHASVLDAQPTTDHRNVHPSLPLPRRAAHLGHQQLFHRALCPCPYMLSRLSARELSTPVR